MIENLEHTQLAGVGRIGAMFQWLCGHPREYPVDHQVFDWVIFSGGILFASGGIENTLLGITPTWPMFVSAAVAWTGYYLVRFKRRFMRPMTRIFFVAWMLLSLFGWYTNGGLLGSTPLWMLLFISYITVLGGQLIGLLAMGAWLTEFAALAALQIANPRSVAPYPTTRIGYIDVTFGVFVVALYLIGYVEILSYNLERRRRQADQLLLNILPRKIAERLEYAPSQMVAENVERASVLFADVVSFTPMTADMAASDLIELLNEVFSAFDTLVEQPGLEKIKTIGDCYMVAAGVPESRDDHACVLADLALAMQQYVSGRMFKGKELSFRIGINSGPLVAGVIGRKKFIYDLWGDTVNTASRMESHGVAGRVQVTESTRGLIEREFCVEPRGIIAVKGKGEMPVWFVTRRRAAPPERHLRFAPTFGS